jgi:hypothetical protein
MSAYELDDALVRELIETTYAPDKMDAAIKVATILAEQLPIAPPPRLAAVVQTVNGSFIAVAPADESQEYYRWFEFGRSEEGRWFCDATLPKVTKVLSEGVDL